MEVILDSQTMWSGRAERTESSFEQWINQCDYNTSVPKNGLENLFKMLMLGLFLWKV